MASATGSRVRSRLSTHRETAMAPAEGVVRVEPGVLVRVKGLQAKGAEHNNSIGMVMSKHQSQNAPVGEDHDSSKKPADARWVIRVMGGDPSKLVAVREENLYTARAGPAWLQSALAIAAAGTVAVGAVAMAAGAGTCLSGLAPLCSLVWYLTTLAVCYWLHAPLLQDGVWCPAISEMGVSRPAKLVYRVGFGVCSSMLALTVLLLRDLALRHDSTGTPGIEWGLAAAAGVALQGVCVLNLDVGFETIAHLGGAMLAMMGTMQHGQASNKWFSALPKESPLLRQGLASMGLWLRRDAADLMQSGIVMVLFLIPLVMQLMSRLAGGGSGNAVGNSMGVMQWVIVSCIAGFYTTYILDLTAL